MRIISLSLVIAALVAPAFLCGCETVGAMSTGRMTKEDVGYIVKAGAPGKKSPPVQVDSLNVDDGYTISSHPMARWREAWRKVAAVDPWIEEKLW
jgi:hypothetical protein